MQKLSLRNALIYPYVLLVSLLAIAIGVLSYMSGSHAVWKVSDLLIEETVSRIGQAVDRHVVGSTATLEAAFPTGIAAPVSIKKEFEELRKRFWVATSLHIDPNNYVYYGNSQGQAIGLYRHSYEIGELRVKLGPENHRKIYRFQGIDGELQFEGEEQKLFDPRTRPWYLAGQSTSADIWTSVYIDFTTEELVVTRARRVLDEHGDFQGVVATDMSLEALNNFVSKLEVSPNGLAFILEPDGNLIASSCSPNVKNGANGKKVRLNAADSGNTLLTEIFEQLQPSLSKASEQLEVTTFFFEDSTGQKIHVAYELFEDSAGLCWINVVAMPSDDFLGGISTSVIQTMLLGLLATIIVVLIGLWILSWVTADLKLLSVAVNQVGRGQLEPQIDIRRNDEIGDLAKSFKAMKYRLQTDHLTGLPNRYAFEQALNATIQRCQGPKDAHSFAILFIDINDFKMINDIYGHDAGDQALIEFALRLRTHIRQNDMVARYAGDEFVILLNDVAQPEDLAPIKENIVGALNEPMKSFDSSQLHIGGAVGEAHFPVDANNAGDLLIIADHNMYAHKAEVKQRRKERES